MTATEVVDMITQMDPATIAGGIMASFFGVGGAAVASKKERATASTKAPKPSKVEKIDVSIPYDAAARLAYDEFRAHGKEADYESFKQKYDRMTVAQVTLKKCEREMVELN